MKIVARILTLAAIAILYAIVSVAEAVINAVTWTYNFIFNK